MATLVVAFGSLVAAGLPLMLTMAGLLVAAGALVLADMLAPVSTWALNFDVAARRARPSWHPH
jgi:RND superfamily putative drug exporter